MFPRNETGTRVRSPKPPFYETALLSPSDPFCVDKRVVSKRVVSADVPQERKPERGYVRQNHPFTKPPFYLPVKKHFLRFTLWEVELYFGGNSGLLWGKIGFTLGI